MYKALNYWVFGGFGPNRTPYEFIDFEAVVSALRACGYDRTFTVEMIPFSRLPDLVLPDEALAEKSVSEFLEMCSRAELKD